MQKTISLILLSLQICGIGSIAWGINSSCEHQPPKLKSSSSRINQEIISDIAHVGTISLIAFSVLYTQDKALKKNEANTFTKLGTALGLSTVMSTLLQKPIKRLLNRFMLKTLPSFALDEKLRKLSYYQKNFDLKKDSLSLELSFAGQKILDRLSGFLETDMDHFGLHVFERSLDDFFALPDRMKKIDTSLLSKIRGLISPYSEETQAAIRNFIQEIYLASIGKSSSARITPLLLIGLPGTGKTHFVSNLANIIGLPIFKINLTDYPTNEKLDGIYDPWLSKYSRGVILDTLVRGQGFKNIILFIDEIDKAVLSSNNDEKTNMYKTWLLNILDPSVTKYYSPVYDAPLSIENLIIIMAANKEFEDASTSQRVNKIYFSGFSKEIKLQMATTLIKDAGLDVDQSLEKELESIVEWDNQGGVRILRQVINKYIIHQQSVNNLKDLYAPGDSQQFDFKKVYNQALQRLDL